MIDPPVRPDVSSPQSDSDRSDPLVSDGALVTRAVAGDGAAWRELHDRIFGLAWREAYYCVGDRSVAEEVVAEAMFAVVKNLGRIDPDECKLRGWVRTIVRNKANDWGRRRSRQRIAFRKLCEAAPEADYQLPDAGVCAREEAETVFRVFESLRDEHREMLQMKYIEGMAIAEMAERLEKTPKAIEATLYRARKEFRSQYKAMSRDSPSIPRIRPFPAT